MQQLQETNNMSPGAQLWDAMKTGNLDLISDLLSQHPELMNRRITGGDLLYRACQRYSLPVIKLLISKGFSLHSVSELYGVSTLTAAARKGRLDIVEFLLGEGVQASTETALQNPLFAAVSGGNTDIVKLMLGQGIDATIAYTSDTMNNMNAIGFGFWNFKDECAEIIIDHLAKGDLVYAEELRAAAKATF